MRVYFILLLSVLTLRAATEQITPVPGDWGGGQITGQTQDCIPAAQRAEVQKIISERATRSPKVVTPQLYPFQPIAGTIWQDRFINNFVDLDSTTGILDWDCTDFTYDGHTGHDIDLRHFGEMDIGVPIFAALDGTVIATNDGQFDRQTSWSSTNGPANYVILDHGNGHQTLYWHMRKGSVAVSVGQVIKAGTQLGLAGSSGFSTGPHLHFESQFNGVVYEPYAGNCQQSNPSRWVTQTPIRRDMYLELFAMHGTNNVTPFFPENPPRKGTFVITGSYQPIGCWYVIHNQSASSTWRLRYLRPNGTLFFDSGTQNFGNSSAYRYAMWWFYYNLSPDVSGTWNLEASVNGQVMVTAPFTVLDAGKVPTNRPPNAFTAAFDPVAPNTNNVVFCRLTPSLIEDPDYDTVRYRYLWQLNGATIRDTTNAAFADAIPHNIANRGDFLKCTVTALDGTTNSAPVSVSTFIGGFVAPQLAVTNLLNGFRVAWPTSGPPFALEFNTNLSFNNWQAISNGISQSGAQNVITNPGTGGTRFLRLRFSY